MTDEIAEQAKPEAEPVALSEPMPEPQPAKRSGLAGHVVGGVIAAGLGFGLAQVVPQGWLLQDTAALQSALDMQAKEIADLKAAVAKPAPAPDFSAVAAQISALEVRIVALETQPAPVSDDAVKALQAEIDALKAAPMAAVDTSALQAMMQEAEASAAKIKADADAVSAKAAAKLALAQLQAALDTGVPFASVLPALGEVPQILKENAETGLPSLAQLSEAFPIAARAAIDAGLRANMGESWSERATNFLRTQTGARALTPQDGSDPDAILSRAEAALQQGDLKAALAEVASLPETAATPMAEWRASAEKRQAGIEAVAGLAAALDQ